MTTTWRGHASAARLAQGTLPRTVAQALGGGPGAISCPLISIRRSALSPTRPAALNFARQLAAAKAWPSGRLYGLGVSVTEHVAVSMRVERDDAPSLEATQDAGASALKGVGHIGGREARQRAELGRAVRARNVHTIEEDRVQVRVELQVGAAAKPRAAHLTAQVVREASDLYARTRGKPTAARVRPKSPMRDRATNCCFQCRARTWSQTHPAGA